VHDVSADMKLLLVLSMPSVLPMDGQPG